MRRMLVAAVALLAALPAVASAAPPTPGGTAGADSQSTNVATVAGPTAPGLAFAKRLENLDVLRGTDTIADGAGHVLFQGIDNVTDRHVLIAVDADTGDVAWTTEDIDAYCIPVADDGGRIFAQVREQTPLAELGPDKFSADLIALDAATGQPISGLRHTPPDTPDNPQLGVCTDALRLTPDGDTVLLADGSSKLIRAFDVSGTDITETWNAPYLYNGALGNVELSLSPDGTSVYFLSAGQEDVLNLDLNKLSVATGAEVARIVVGTAPSSPRPRTNDVLVDGEDGVVVSVGQCDTRTDCLSRYADDGASFDLSWKVEFDWDDEDTTLRRSLGDLALSGTRVVGTAGDVLHAYDLADGARAWIYDGEGFHNGGDPLVDVDGNIYVGLFGGPYLVRVTPDGREAWALQNCSLTGLNSTAVTVGPLMADGTLVTSGASRDENGENNRVTVYAFNDDERIPKGTCPETETRVEGVNRIVTSVEISEASFPQPDSADTVVIATAFNYPDALAGGPLARKLDAPLLLTGPGALDPATAAEVQRLGATNAVLLGGTAALSDQVRVDLEALGLTVRRINGTNRFDTAAMIAAEVPATSVYVTEGANPVPTRGWPDAVAVSGLASFELKPILLVTRDAVPEETRAAMGSLGVTQAVVVGGTAAVSADTEAALADYDGDGTAEAAVSRESGASRFATSVKVAERSIAAGASTLDLWFATGLSFPDALAAGPAVARSGGVLLLVHGQDVAGGPEVYAFLEGLADEDVLNAWFVGGTAAITDAVAEKLADAAGIG